MTYNMIMFKERLKDLIDEKKIPIPQAACELHINSKTLVYNWIKGKMIPKLDNAIKLRDYFECSLDYLFNNAEYEKIMPTKPVSTFAKKLKQILNEKHITREKFLTDLNMSNNNFNNWYKLELNPRMDTVTKIANYLQVSIDYLVGLE